MDTQGTKIAHPDATLGDSDLEFLYAHTSHYGAVNEFGEHVGRQYGLSTGQSQSYNVDIHQGEIVFNNNGHDLDFRIDGIDSYRCIK